MSDHSHHIPTPTLGHLLVKVSRLVGIRMRAKLDAFGLNHAQGMTLFHLWRNEGIAQSSLAQVLNITPPTTTSTLQRMERDGWIQRRRDEEDQRVVRVFLTDQAKALRQEVRLTFQELDRELTSVLSDDECHVLMASLVKVHGYLSRAMPNCDPSALRSGDRCENGKDTK